MLHDPSVPLEMWGGLECSVVRVHKTVVDEVRLTGHQDRPADIDAIAGLGLKAVRYPVLWERTAPRGPEQADWRWADDRLGRLRAHGVRPVLGLLHHGGGPLPGGLVDPGFVQGLADYAARVAERYPWADAYTPVNEILTTARFSGLYGLWRPHGRDHRSFLRILLNQVRATRAAMRAIRRVNPRAQLIQTEDLGKTHSTPRLSYQAAFENERRWLSLDLLTGRVVPGHPLWVYLTKAGIQAELEDLAADPCPPDILAIDHYLTSERFLDERLERYPGWSHGGNERERYADVEAVRVVAEGTIGYEALLEEAWRRYGIPVAAGEVHNNGTRDEQARWLKEVWDGALRLKAAGVDIRAVTVWALFGSYEWNSLLTRRTGHYEPGPFDVRAPQPRPTALARMVRDLATTGATDHPVLDAPGWWHRADRFVWPPVRCCPYTIQRRVWTPPAGRERPRPLLVAGGGALARAVARIAVLRGLPCRVLGRDALDAADPASVAAALERERPWAAVNAVGFARIDAAQRDPERSTRANLTAARVLAEGCAAAGLPLLTLSSHLVFDGAKGTPYLESDAPAPLNAYGAVKAEAERAVLAVCHQSLVVRSGPLFGAWDEGNFLSRTVAALEAGEEVVAAEDETVSPTYLPDLVQAALDLLIDAETGIWYLASPGATTWASLARAAAARTGFDPARIRGVAAAALRRAAPRPAYSVLASARGGPMPPLEQALDAWAAARSAEPARRAEPLGPAGDLPQAAALLMAKK